MKKIVIAAASLMFVATAQAEESLDIGVEMTPIVKEQPAKAARRFENYALENSSSH